jgi:hypothetical protein
VFYDWWIDAAGVFVQALSGGLLLNALGTDFGRHAFATIEGFAAIVTMLGPVVVGFLADTLRGYRPGLLFRPGVTGVGMAFFWLAPRPRVT